MIPGEGAGKGDSPRAVNLAVYSANLEAIDWRTNAPQPYWLRRGKARQIDEYAGLNIHERSLKTYYERECSGELSPEIVRGEHKRFRDAHKTAIERGL